MALGAVLATALTNRAAREWSLTIDGVDVMSVPSPAIGNRATVDIDSVVVTEAAPGRVSRLSFTIDDPLKVVTFLDSALVRLTHLAIDVVEFVGWVDTAEKEPQAIGRKIHVECIGVEAALDWRIVPPMTVPQVSGGAILAVGEACQLILAASVGPAGTGLQSAIGNTLDAMVQVSSGISLPADFVIDSPMTLRQALEALGVFCSNGVGFGAFIAVSVSWDFQLMVTGYLTNSGTGWGVTPLVQLIINTAGPTRPANGRHSVGQGDSYRAAYVQGGNAAGTGLVSDGSGVAGPTAIIQDDTILTATARDAAANAAFSSGGDSATGSLTLESFQQVAGRDTAHRVWDDTRITDPNADLVSQPTRMQSIRKRYTAGGTLEDWTITYGSRPRLGSDMLRSLTRDRV